MTFVIIFVLSAIAIYLFKHFEQRRDERNERQHEKRRKAYEDLLDRLKEKEDTNTK